MIDYSIELEMFAKFLISQIDHTNRRLSMNKDTTLSERIVELSELNYNNSITIAKLDTCFAKCLEHRDLAKPFMFYVAGHH